MKTLTLLTSGTNASAGLIRAGVCHSRLLPTPILRTERWVLRAGGEIRLNTGAQCGTNPPPAHRLLQVARLQGFQPQVWLLLTVSPDTLHLFQARDRKSS